MSLPQAILLWQDNHPTLALWELTKETFVSMPAHQPRFAVLQAQLVEQGGPHFDSFEQLYDRVANWVQEIMIDAAAEVQHQQPDE